jgi:elongation factor Ts
MTTTTTVSAKDVGELRKITGAGLIDCKKALAESGGNQEKAIEYLRKKGIASADKKAGREATEGLIQSYIHMGGKVGVLIEINCETDFVAKNEAFHEFTRDICMHIAAVSPQFVSRDQVDPVLLEKEKEVIRAQMQGKPEHAIEKIMEGKLTKYCSDICLLDQPFVKNPDITIGDYLKEKISALGENIIIKRFVRYQIGG